MDTAERIAEIEADLKRRDEQIRELKQERTEALELVDAMREHVEASGEMIEHWKYAFDMEQDEAGVWMFEPSKVSDAYMALLDKHEKMVREWNRFVGEYNGTVAPRVTGRPLGADDAKVKEVLKLRKNGLSLRAIVSATGLTLRTVRTIVEKDAGTDRASKRTNLLRKREFDRLRAADYRARKKARDRLPKAITEAQKRGEELMKAAKGLGG